MELYVLNRKMVKLLADIFVEPSMYAKGTKSVEQVWLSSRFDDRVRCARHLDIL